MSTETPLEEAIRGQNHHGVCNEHHIENDAADNMTDTCVVCKKELLLW